MTPTTAPCGSWRSPITAELITRHTVALGGVAVQGDDVYWLEGRPTEGGRYVLVRRRPDGRTEDVTPPPYNVRTRVHEYGGGAYLLDEGEVYFANFADQRLHRVRAGEQPSPLTTGEGYRYAEGVIDRARARSIWVREDHTDSDREPVNAIVAVDLAGGDPGLVLAAGADFYAAPRLSPGGDRLAWIEWRHPNMPWDGTELWLADLRADGSLGERTRLAGGESESVLQPLWAEDGSLYFISDRSDWWNLYCWRSGRVEPVAPLEAEFARPLWTLGARQYALAPDGTVVCSYTRHGAWRLATIAPGGGRPREVEVPYTDISGVTLAGERAYLLASSPSQPVSVVAVDLRSEAVEVLKRSTDLTIDEGYLSLPEAVEFPTEGGLTAHGLFYAPRNRDFAAAAGELPPLLVMSHGGPTSAASSSLNLGIQYWTSRGIAVLDVNYGGSSGYGRAYRERLKGRWGIVDVDDCVNGARHLAERGLVDGRRLLITGGSAGGYTTLCALAFHDLFRAGASHFGVSDLEALALDTHKFESRYLDSLVGPYPERRDLYVQRSPIHHVDRLSCPVVFFQGLEDKIVPPDQAERMVESLRRKGIPVAYVAFPGEQHGFRRAESIRRALEGELYFYSRVLGFPLAEPVEPILIEGL
jgi:dipeptidyl aminopeptidase/acylaminoacyl peptidase